MSILDRALRMGEAKKFKAYEQRVGRINLFEEELELEVAIHPDRGGARDGLLAALAVLVVVGASVAMERTGSELGARHAIPGIVVGGLVLVTALRVLRVPHRVAESRKANA